MKQLHRLAPLFALATLLTPLCRADLISNGSFELTTATTTSFFQSVTVNDWADSDIGESIVLPSWFTNGYIFPNVGLAGPFPQSSPDGGNFVLSDGDYHNSPITQTINGLNPGDTYTLTFYQALVQDVEPLSPGPFITHPGPVTGEWQVTLGTDVQLSTLMNANGLTLTISPWAQQTMTFTAQNTSEVLSFLSIGTGEPPLVGLDGISLVESPEPANIWLAGIGAVMLGWALLARRKRNA